MAETRTAWLPAYCTCTRCEPRRQELEHASACPCKQCQPGEGIDFGGLRRRMSAQQKARMNVLLHAARQLTPDEESELEDLLHAYLHNG